MQVVVVVQPSDPEAIATTSSDLARRLVGAVGGRYSSELGIDVDAGEAQVERWFLAATLFGTRISARTAVRTYGVLRAAGLSRVTECGCTPWEELVELLDQGGYARYDFRTATRLQALAAVISAEYHGLVAVIGVRFRTYPELHDALDALPGWGPVTVELFLRELRGVWPGAEPPLGERAVRGARHLGFLGGDDAAQSLGRLADLSTTAGLDPRDLESALVRLTLAHAGGMDVCAGGGNCLAVALGERAERTP
jgi:hypothetical protein